ncbi:hypothetical protein [uncultured Aquimarina sp.]|uniref:hypothetical protein n=1 Tax=uncultured Aquimarina sp. TaxID=575652 RepID=UPI0026386163|nr:hypothetical protein [uncultured Aquimarina sp.]
MLSKYGTSIITKDFTMSIPNDYFLDFSNVEYTQVREAHHGAVQAIRRAYYLMHDFITPGRTLMPRQRQLIEDSLFATFLSNSSNLRPYTHISNYDWNFRLIHRNLYRLNRHSSHYEVRRSADAVNGNDFARSTVLDGSYAATTTGVHNHRNQSDNDNPNIVLFDLFFTTSYSNRLRIIIHELCHAVLGFDNPRSFRNSSADAFSNDIYLENINVFNAMSFNQSILNPDKHALFVLLVTEITLAFTSHFNQTP